MPESSRISDINGYVEIRDNPLSKVGVFPYSGAQIGLTGAEAEKIFNVYRPAEELGAPETIASFKLQPWIDEHAMLGDVARGLTAPEQKGIGGVIGENITFDGTYLRGNIKIFSEAQKRLIANGKKELSAGYRCKYVPETGTFDGKSYQYRQTMIRANHLATVQDGRSGPDVAVLDAMAFDEMTFTIDAKELAAMADEKTPSGGDTLAQIKALVDQLKPLLEQQAEAQALLAELGLIPVQEQIEPVVDEEPKPEVVEEVLDESTTTTEEEGKPAMDAMLKELRSLRKEVGALKAGQTGMDSALILGIAQRDELAEKLSPFIGTFDHKSMTPVQVAKYGVEKLGLTGVTAGQEAVALNAYLHGRVPAHKQPVITGFGLDSAEKPADIWGEQNKERA